jgi:hypothetical protein
VGTRDEHAVNNLLCSSGRESVRAIAASTPAADDRAPIVSVAGCRAPAFAYRSERVPIVSRRARTSSDAQVRPARSVRVGCIYSIGRRLGGDAVLVDEAAEPVVPVGRGGWLACPGRRRLPWFGGCEFERTVRPMAVVVVDELPQNML